MLHRSNNFSHARRGTTLVEVIAGLVILGTILSSMLIARGRFVRQEVLAQRKLAAVESLDALVAQWMAGPVPNVPLRGSGSFASELNQTWRTGVLPDASARLLGSQVVRVEVFDPSSRTPIVSLDLMVAMESSGEVSR